MPNVTPLDPQQAPFDLEGAAETLLALKRAKRAIEDEIKEVEGHVSDFIGVKPEGPFKSEHYRY